MAASYPTAIKSFTTKVDGVDYPQASHINDLQLEVEAIETELRINAKGVYHSDTAPASPVADQLWHETDTNILWVYGTFAAASRWVSVDLKDAAFSSGGSAYSANLTAIFGQGNVNGYDIYIDTLYVKAHVLTTNDGSNYWTWNLRKVSGSTAPAAGAGSSLATVNSSAKSAAAWFDLSASVNAVVDMVSTSIESLQADITKTSAPGNVWSVVGFTYRLVHP